MRRASHTGGDRRRVSTPTATRLLVAVLVVMSLLGGVAALSGGAQAQTTTTSTNNSSVDEKAPYYSNFSTETGQDAWLEGREEATLESLLSFIADVDTYVIGGGVTAQGGTGSAGAFITAAVVAAVFLLAIARSPVGPVGGATLAVVVGGGMTTAGIAPEWMYALLLMPLGFILAALIGRNL